MSIGLHSVLVTPVGGAETDVSCLVDEVEIQHGRDDSTQQPVASTAVIDLDLIDTELPAECEIGSTLKVVTTVGATPSVRFVGRITDINTGWDDNGTNTPDSGIAQIIATSPMADLGRRVVGDAPFPQELDGARVSRILTLAGFTPSPATSDPGTVQILATDIDARAALDAAGDTATSAGGMVWQTRAGDVRYADSAHRRNIVSSLTLDACDILVTPTWTRTVQGMVNKATIAYGVAPTGGEQPTTSGSNATSIGRFGTFDFSMTSQLAALADAQAMVGLLLARNSTPVWVMTSLPVDVKGLSDAETLTLLGLEMHSLIVLTGLPLIAPMAPTTANLWVEGWAERLAWDLHEIELHVSGYCRTAPAPRWDDVDPTWTWDTSDPAMTWDDAQCLGPPVSHGRWNDVSASTRWDTVKPVNVKWDEWTG